MLLCGLGVLCVSLQERSGATAGCHAKDAKGAKERDNRELACGEEVGATAGSHAKGAKDAKERDNAPGSWARQALPEKHHRSTTSALEER